MNKKAIAAISGATLLALTTTASAAACPITTILTMDIRIIISKFGCRHDRNLPDGAKIVASRSRRFWIART